MTKQYCIFVTPKDEFGGVGRLGFPHMHECILKIMLDKKDTYCVASFPNRNADLYRPLQAYHKNVAQNCPLYSTNKRLSEMIKEKRNLPEIIPLILRRRK